MAMNPTKSNAAPAPRMENQAFLSTMDNIGQTLRRNVVSSNRGRETPKITEVDKAYSAFMNSIKDQKDALKDATEDQKTIFKELVEEIIKLRKDEKGDFERSHKEFQAALSAIHEKGGPEEVKKWLENVAATGMQHTDKKKPLGGTIGQEVNHRLDKFFSASKDDLESPLFRKLAGLDKKNPAGMISALDSSKNLGIAEGLKNKLGDDITGEAQREKDLAEKVAGTMNGKGQGGAFPTKIENLHVENLIVKNARREEAPEAEGPKQIEHKGKSAKALPALGYDGPDDDHKVEAKKPEHTEHLKIAHDPNSISDVDFKEVPVERKKPEGPKQVGHVAPKLLTLDAPKAIEPPVQVKQMNPHAKLKTGKTAIAAAVSGALAYTPALAQKPALAGAYTPKNDLLDNDVGVQSADATKYTEKDVEAKDDQSDTADMLEKAAGLASALPDIGGRGRRGRSAKPKGKGLGGRLMKGAKAGALGLGAGLALDYAHDKLEESGHDQLAIGADVASTAASWAGTGAMLGSVIPGVGTAVGGVVGGLAGAAKGTYDNWGKLDKSWMPEWAGGPRKNVGVAPGAANNSGANLNQMNMAAKQHAAQTAQQPVVVQTPAPAASNTNNFVPVNGAPRSRESYFDRQMMGMFTK